MHGSYLVVTCFNFIPQAIICYIFWNINSIQYEDEDPSVATPTRQDADKELQFKSEDAQRLLVKSEDSRSFSIRSTDSDFNF